MSVSVYQSMMRVLHRRPQQWRGAREAGLLMQRIYWIGLRRTKEVAVEEAVDARAACWKAGWDPEWCETRDITDEIRKLVECGDLEVIEGPPLEF